MASTFLSVFFSLSRILNVGINVSWPPDFYLSDENSFDSTFVKEYVDLLDLL